MFNLFEDSDFKQNVNDSRVLEHLASSKPYLQFNHELRICGCNELFVAVFKISENELLASDLSHLIQNRRFIETVHAAVTMGISTYHGKVLLGTGLPEVYLEAVLFNTRIQNPDEGSIFCFILENVNQVVENKSIIESIESELKVPAFLNASISVHTPDGSVIYISPSTESMLGYSCAELMELGSLNLVHPDDLPAVKKAIEKLNSGLDFVSLRYRMAHKNGSIVSVETTSYMLGDASGTAHHMVNVTWDLDSLQEMEHALRISEQKYYRLVMNLPVGVTLISASGKLLEANEAMKKIMRIPPRISIAELNFLSIDVMKRSGISAQFLRCIESMEMVNGNVQLKLSNKAQDSFLAYSFVPILGQNGEVESVIGYVQDLSIQKRAENDYRERADFLNLVINTIKNSFFVKDENHRWVMLNDAAVKMMGQPREALLGKSDYDLFPEEQADVFWKYDEQVFNSGSSRNEEQITWSDGTIHTIVTYKQLYIEKSSGKKFIVGISHDITRYKKIEEELRASDTKYRELFNNANDFIFTMDMGGNITNANRTLLRYLQTDLDFLIQHNVFEFIREDNFDLVNEIMAKMLAGDASDYSFEVNAYGLGRKEVIYEVKANLIRQNGVPVGVQCVLIDVTEQKEASLKLEKFNESLLELNTTKDKFFSIIAHDLRSPYSSLIGFSEMLLDDLDEMTKDEIKDSLKIIHGSAKNSFNLLENLLAWSRLETGHMTFNPVQVGLTDAVEEVVNVLFSLAYRKKIEINNLVDPEVELFADKNMLNTILNNLLLNAIKFTNPGGEINIYTGTYLSDPKSKNDFVKISVADTGIGMDAETCQKIFTAGKLVSTPGTEKEQGTGLGLVLTREMVEKHGGSIMVESSTGDGSVFSFLIPLFKPESKS